MDYDASTLPQRYAAARSLAPATLRQWLDVIAGTLNPARLHRILDLGCGTGRFSCGLHDRFSTDVLGMDPSHRMLSQAPRSRGVRYVQAAAEALPLDDSAVDMVFMSMVWHHLGDKYAAAAEIRRVLNTGGHMCVRTSTAETLDSCLYLRFFPEARRISEATMPTRHNLIEWAMEHGFDLLRHVCVVQELDPSPADYCARIQRRGLSDLASITDEQFHCGLASLCQYFDEKVEPRPVKEAVDLFVFH